MTQTVPRRGQAKPRKADPGRAGNRLTAADEQRIIEAYNAGVSIHGVAGTLGYSRNAVRRVLRNSPEVQLRDDGCKPKMSRDELIQRHKAGQTPRMIADACGAHIKTVHQRLADLGLEIQQQAVGLPDKEIVAAYRSGVSMAELARSYGAGRRTIAMRLAAAGHVSEGRDPVISSWKLADLCRRGMTVPEMSRATGIGSRTLRKHLAAAGMRAADKRPGRERPAFVPKDFGRPAA